MDQSSLGQKGGKGCGRGHSQSQEGGGARRRRTRELPPCLHPKRTKAAGQGDPGPGFWPAPGRSLGSPPAFQNWSQPLVPQARGTAGRGWGEPGQTWFSPSLSKHHLGDQGSQGQFGNRESCPLPHLPWNWAEHPLSGSTNTPSSPQHGHLETLPRPTRADPPRRGEHHGHRAGGSQPQPDTIGGREAGAKESLK